MKGVWTVRQWRGRLSQLLSESGSVFTRLRKERFAATVIGVATIYKLMELSSFTGPLVKSLDRSVGSGTVVEILLGVLIVHLIAKTRVSHNELAPQILTAHQGPSLTGNSIIKPSICTTGRHQATRDGGKEEAFGRLIPVPRKIPNIVAKRARVAWLKKSGNILYEPEVGGNVQAVVAEFRNEVGDSSAIAWHHVRASIAYFNRSGSEIADVGRAAWLEEIGSVIDLPSYVTRRLIVAIRAGNGTWTASDGTGNSTRVLPADIRRARIILHDNKQFSFSYSLAVQMNQGVLESLATCARRD